MAIRSQRSKRAVCDNDVQRGDSMQMATRSKTWLLGARCLVCGCGGGGGGSGQKILRLSVICQHTLDPGSSCCALALLTNADLKADITLLRNIISKQRPQPT